MFNFLFVWVGVSLLALGIYLHVKDPRPIIEWIDFVLNPALFLAVLGFLVTFISLVGALGALRDNISLLKIFAICVFFCYICIVVLTFGVFVLFFTDSTEGLSAHSIMMQSVKKYHSNRNLADFVDYIQEQMECCGVSSISAGYRDWAMSPQFNCTPTNPYPEKSASWFHQSSPTGNAVAGVLEECAFQATARPRSRYPHAGLFTALTNTFRNACGSYWSCCGCDIVTSVNLGVLHERVGPPNRSPAIFIGARSQEARSDGKEGEERAEEEEPESLFEPRGGCFPSAARRSSTPPKKPATKTTTRWPKTEGPELLANPEGIQWGRTKDRPAHVVEEGEAEEKPATERRCRN
ncbi:unnamed protein product, partial [Mesorhabditis spiculigera]